MIAWPPASRQPADVTEHGGSAPATSPPGAAPARLQPTPGWGPEAGHSLSDLVRAVLGQLLPFAAVLITSYRVSEWLALGLTVAWLGYRRFTGPRTRTRTRSREIARRSR